MTSGEFTDDQVLELLFQSAPSIDDLYTRIVNTPFDDKLHSTKMGLGIVVLLLVNETTQTIDRIALSNTELADGAVQMSAKPFHDIKVPMHHADNLLSKTVDTRTPHETDDWKFLFIPELTPEEARLNQAGAGIACSITYPLIGSSGEAFGAMIFSYYEPLTKITGSQHVYMNEYTSIVSDQLENYLRSA